MRKTNSSNYSNDAVGKEVKEGWRKRKRDGGGRGMEEEEGWRRKRDGSGRGMEEEDGWRRKRNGSGRGIEEEEELKVHFIKVIIICSSTDVQFHLNFKAKKQFLQFFLILIQIHISPSKFQFAIQVFLKTKNLFFEKKISIRKHQLNFTVKIYFLYSCQHFPIPFLDL